MYIYIYIYIYTQIYMYVLKMLDYRNCTQITVCEQLVSLLLDQNGFEARQIMTVLGEKSVANIRSYSRYVSDGKMREMNLALTAHMTCSVTNKSPSLLLSSEITNVLLDIGAQLRKLSSFVFNFHNCTVNI